MSEPKRDLVRVVLGILCIAFLIAGSLVILRPFAEAIAWATMLAVATWPALRALERLLGGRRKLATTILTLALLFVVVGPLLGGVESIIRNVDQISAFATNLPNYQVPPPPDWLAGVPLVGARADEIWSNAATAGVPTLLKDLAPYAKEAVPWLASKLGSVGGFLVQFLLTVILTAVMYTGGESAVSGLRKLARRVAGHHGDDAITLAGGAIRGVAMGVVVTALAQSLFAGLGLLIAGVPFTAALTMVMFILAIAQIGPIPVLIGVVIWTFSTQGAGWGTFILIWAVVAGTMDNFIRPVLIKRGADLPLLLIFAGVIGGLLAFGLIGIFAGPVLLAVTYTLLQSWLARDDEAAPAPPTPAVAASTLAG